MMPVNWLPENISTYGHKIDHVIAVIYYIVGAWFIAVQAFLFYCLIRFRRRPGERAAYLTGNSFKSLAPLSLLVLVVAGFDVGIDLLQGPVWHEVKIERPANPDLTVRVMARQFFWDFVYPGPDGTLGTADDLTSPAKFTVPAHQKVLIELESKDVIHSFWVPELRLKQDIVPGRRIQGWFEAIKTGTFDIGCAELCGVGHGNMRGTLAVVTADEYAAWLEKLAQSGAEQEDGW